MLRSYLIHVRSKDCTQITSGFNTDMRVNLKSAIYCEDNEVMHISLSDAEIPIAWYSFSSNLKTLDLYCAGIPCLVLTPGNYDIYELIVAINADATFQFNATYNDNTGKVTLTNGSGGSIVINFTNVLSLGLAQILGFLGADQTVAAGASIVGSQVVQLQVVHSLFVYSDLSISNVFTTENGSRETILDKIPVIGHPWDTIHHNPELTAPFTSEISNNIIQNFSIAIRDQNFILLDMNGVRFELSLFVEIYPKYKRVKIDKEIDPAPIPIPIPPVPPIPIPTIPIPAITIPAIDPIPIPPTPRISESDKQVASDLEAAMLFISTL